MSVKWVGGNGPRHHASTKKNEAIAFHEKISDFLRQEVYPSYFLGKELEFSNIDKRFRANEIRYFARDKANNRVRIVWEKGIHYLPSKGMWLAVEVQNLDEYGKLTPGRGRRMGLPAKKTKKTPEYEAEWDDVPAVWPVVFWDDELDIAKAVYMLDASKVRQHIARSMEDPLSYTFISGKGEQLRHANTEYEGYSVVFQLETWYRSLAYVWPSTAPKENENENHEGASIPEGHATSQVGGEEGLHQASVESNQEPSFTQ